MNQLADSYLEHIRIAVAIRDPGAPYRTFFDNWYAQASGGHHLTTGGRPIWLNNPCALTKAPILRALAFRSLAAEAIINGAAADPGYANRRRDKDPADRLLVDHAVPVSVLRRMLWAIDPAPARAEIAAFLKRWYVLGVITPSEDLRLRHAGLTKDMPSDWNGTDQLARYRAVGID